MFKIKITLKNSLFVFLFALSQQVVASDLHTDWYGIEHDKLGDAGMKRACKEMGIAESDCPRQQIFRKDQKSNFNYGDLLAFPDLYDTADQFYNERGMPRDLSSFVDCTHNWLRIPGNVKCLINSVRSTVEWLEVVSRNIDHFGWHNMRAYVQNHKKALELAVYSFKLRNEGKSAQAKIALDRALIVNSFADHYLTDAFAAGHIRVPRREFEVWAEKKLGGILRNKRADLMTMIFHELDGVDAFTGEEGMAVQNARGDQWVTRSDGHLQKPDEDNPTVYLMPLEAVTVSTADILKAAKFGKVNPGVYPATWYVPYPDVQEGFVEKWQRTLRDKPEYINDMRAQVPAAIRWVVSEKNLKYAVKNLGVIMDLFHKRIQSDLDTNPELSERLPKSYIKAFLNME